MTFNLKTQNKPVKMGSFGRSTNVAVSSSTVTEQIYSLDSSLSGTGISATLSSGSVSLAGKNYLGFFKPYMSGSDQFEFYVKVNGSLLSTQNKAFKSAVSSMSSIANLTRYQPLFFSYSATAGDVLTIYYEKTAAAAIANIYNYTLNGGSILYLMEIDK